VRVRKEITRLVIPFVAADVGILTAGCGRQYVVLHPAGPVGLAELRLIETAAIPMAVVILFVFVLFGIAVWRFRERPHRKSAYAPNWNGGRWLEFALFVIPVLIVVFIAVPTVEQTFALDRLPPAKHPLIIDVTSLDFKWMFQYPRQGIATVNYIDVPVGKPLLFELTANSPMNTFWVPQLGGMEFAMPGRVLPLYLQADRAGVYRGESANFSGRLFVRMVFQVHAVSPARFAAWVASVRRKSPPMTLAGYRQLLSVGVAVQRSFSSYPADTFPKVTHGFTLQGGMYLEPPASRGP
jgi:cytochrome aa3-600 menaquinol oxidase subunit 2